MLSTSCRHSSPSCSSLLAARGISGSMRIRVRVRMRRMSASMIRRRSSTSTSIRSSSRSRSVPVGASAVPARAGTTLQTSTGQVAASGFKIGGRPSGVREVLEGIAAREEL
eukprot:1133623-Rhodomonas_salina.2